MQDWLITTISLLGSAIVTASITTIVGILIKKFVTKENTKTEELNRLRDEHISRETQEKIETTIREEIKPIIAGMEEINIKVNQIGEGTLSTLRNDILTCYYRCREKGYRNDYDTQNMNDLYNAYSQLHGNSFIADVMKRFSGLPTKEEYEEKKKKVKKVLNE